MEDYGIGAATKTALGILQRASRRSGRTERMVERARSGDWIIVASDPERARVEQLLRDAEKPDVRVRVCLPHREERAWQFGTNSRGMTFFDAAWVEQWYLLRVEALQAEFTKLQEALSKDRSAPKRFDDWSYRFDNDRGG